MVNMRTGDVFGVKALLRCLHPQKGLVPPLEFFLVIDGTALEIQMGNWVIDHLVIDITPAAEKSSSSRAL
jgi:EAL domain-containing protein (putative c-di-GMP-specific phosphodiesterase class I)